MRGKELKCLNTYCEKLLSFSYPSWFSYLFSAFTFSHFSFLLIFFSCDFDKVFTCSCSVTSVVFWSLNPGPSAAISSTLSAIICGLQKLNFKAPCKTEADNILSFLLLNKIWLDIYQEISRAFIEKYQVFFFCTSRQFMWILFVLRFTAQSTQWGHVKGGKFT